MSMLWKGPSREVTVALGNPIAIKLHRRAGRQGVAYNISHDGRTAEVFRIEGSNGRYRFVPLGTVQGADPLDAYLAAALAFTEHDAELVELATGLIEQRIEALAPALAAVNKQAATVLSDLSAVLSEVASRHV